MKKIFLIILAFVVLVSCTSNVKYSELPKEKQNQIAEYIQEFSKKENMDDLLINFPTSWADQSLKAKYIDSYKTKFTKLLDELNSKYEDIDFSEIEDNYKKWLQDLENNLK